MALPAGTVAAVVAAAAHGGIAARP